MAKSKEIQPTHLGARNGRWAWLHATLELVPTLGRLARGLGAVAAVTAFSPVGVAEAGTYIIRSCNVPGQNSAPAAVWKWFDLAPGMLPNDECASGAGFGINAGPLQRATAGVLGLQTPGEGLPIRQVRLWMVARLGSTGSAMFLQVLAYGVSGVVQQNLFGPPGGDTLRQPYVTGPLPPDTTHFRLLFSCSGNTSEGCVPESPNPVEVRGAEVTLYEDAVPGGAIAGGSLLSGGAQSGTQTVGYTATDRDSGVEQITAQLGTTVVAIADSSVCAYADYAACPNTRTGSLSVDTTKVPDGTYPLLLRITDAAGNREAVQAPGTITVANGTAREFPPNGAGASADAKLTAKFVGHKGTAASVRFLKTVTVQGRLTTAAGAPIGAADVGVTETVAGSRKAFPARSIVTKADGSFAYTSPRRRSSRIVRLEYRPTTAGAAAAVRRLRINVPATATLRVALKGTRVTYSGRLLTLPVPKKGKRVQVEGRAAGGTWTPFAVKVAGKSGRVSGHYRLRVRRPGVRLQFRLRIATQAGYPYAAGTSGVVTRIVR